MVISSSTGKHTQRERESLNQRWKGRECTQKLKRGGEDMYGERRKASACRAVMRDCAGRPRKPCARGPGRQQGPMHAGGPKHACMHVGAPASGCMCRPVVPSCPKPPTPTSCKTTATAGTTSNRYLSVKHTHIYMAKSLISNHAYIPPFYISLHAPSIALDYTTIIETNHVRRDDILLLN